MEKYLESETFSRKFTQFYEKLNYIYYPTKTVKICFNSIVKGFQLVVWINTEIDFAIFEIKSIHPRKREKANFVRRGNYILKAIFDLQRGKRVSKNCFLIGALSLGDKMRFFLPDRSPKKSFVSPNTQVFFKLSNNEYHNAIRNIPARENTILYTDIRGTVAFNSQWFL